MIRAALWIGGLLAGGYAAKSAGEAFRELDALSQTVVIGGSIYAGYRVAQSAGLIK